MTDSPLQLPPVRTQADLEAVWRRLMEPLGFSRHTLWMLLVEADDHALPQLTRFDDVGPGDTKVAGPLATICAQVLTDVEPGARWAFLLSRPGDDGARDADRALARALVDACRRRGVPTEVVHLATDAELVPLPLDDVLAR